MPTAAPSRRRARRPAPPSPAPGGNQRADAPIKPLPVRDTFFRHVVAGMCNGVLAITCDGRVAIINREACRIFDLDPDAPHLNQPVADVLRAYPDVTRVLTGAFTLDLLPNRAELRVRPSGRVIGYTIALVHDDRRQVVGATMFFTDLTRVERRDERNRLRDRLAAVGAMAAAIAHEVKNPLAGIEVMAGLLRRKCGGDEESEALARDIICETKRANAIMQEMLDFVRPIRLHVERTSVQESLHASIPLADAKTPRGGLTLEMAIEDDFPEIQADQYQLTQIFTNLLRNAYEAMEGQGHIRISAQTTSLDEGDSSSPAVQVEIADDGPGVPEELIERVFDPFFTTKAQGSVSAWPLFEKSFTPITARSICEVQPAGAPPSASRCRLPAARTFVRNGRVNTWDVFWSLTTTFRFDAAWHRR